MRIAINQPTFLPGLGYFEQLAESDRFVFLDDAQFSHQSWQQRNKFIINGKESWIGFPIHEKFLPMNRTQISYQTEWGHQNLKKIEASYALKAPYYDRYIPYLHALFTSHFHSVGDMNMVGIILAADILGILKYGHIVLSSDLKSKGRRSEHVVSILEELGATTYLCCKGSVKYMHEDKWDWPGTVLVQDHDPSLSVWHYLMWQGAEKTRNMIPGRPYKEEVFHANQ